MIIKRIVSLSLVLSMVLMSAVLIGGLFVPATVINRLLGKSATDNQVVASDTNGKPIAGAKIIKNSDGTTSVVDKNGNVVAGADATTSTSSDGTTTTNGSTTPAQPGGSSPTDPSQPSPSPTPTPTPTPTPSPTPSPSAPAPSISSFSASPSSIAYGASSTLSWASANASACSMSPWGSVGTGGSRSTGALGASTTYTLVCSGNGSVSRQTTVAVAAAPAPCGTGGGSCTAAQVATHNSPSNCWVIYAGSYYVITNYVYQHNGGSGAFTSSTCGHDITAYMNGSSNAGTSVGKHKHSSGAYNTLNSYKVGPVN